jgi:predicted ATPase/DNA-binding SARP family transcriptional activator
MPEAQARRNLSHHLTHLRQALPDMRVLAAEYDRVGLQTDLIWCDAAILKSSLIDAQTDFSTLKYLAELGCGSFLEGFNLSGCAEFENWCLAERYRLERQYLRVIKSLMEYLAARGQANQAISFAQRYLEINPLSEAMHRRLIQLYAATGDRYLAIQQYESCAAILSTELGVSPLPETRAVIQMALFSQPRFPKAPVSEKPVSTPAAEIPIIGREIELSKLDAAFDQLQARRCQVILIYGEAGIGKSRLLQDFARRCQDRARVLYGCGILGEESIPYQPLLGILHMMLGLDEYGTEHPSGLHQTEHTTPGFAQTAWLAEISRLLPEMRTIYPELNLPVEGDPESARTRLFDALCHLILAFAETNGPVLLCLDDLQWMDIATRAWLVHIGRYLKGSSYPILVLGAYRSEDAESLLELRHNLARNGILVELSLEGLDQGSTHELICNMVGEFPGLVEMAEELQQATDGNPFYIIEIIHKLREEGKLGLSVGAAWHLTLPESIREAVHVRIRRLSPIARQVVEAGAILGTAYSVDMLRLTAGRSHRELMSALDELVARCLLVEALGGFRFAHEIIRQCVEESLGPARRQLLHLRAARAYQHKRADAYPALAYHYERGGDLQKALHQHGLAARQAQSLFAWGAVEEHLGQKLKLLGQIDPVCEQEEPVRQRGEILAERAYICYLQGRLADRDIDLETLSKLGEECDDDLLRLQAILNCLRYLNLDGYYDQAFVVAERGMELVRTSTALRQDTEVAQISLSRLLAQAGFAQYFLGKPVAALEMLEEAWSLCPCQEKNRP